MAEIVEVRLTELAKLDLENLADWYESKKSGLGIELIDSFKFSRIFISQNPYASQIVYENIRRKIIVRFQVCIFYEIREKFLLVVAIVGNKREPQIWKHR